VLVRGLRRGVRRDHRAHALGDEPGDAFADGEGRRADRGRRKAAVAAHHEPLVLDDIHADDVDGHDLRDLVAHRGQHRLERTVVAGELDQAQDPVDATVAAMNHLNAHEKIVTRRMFLRSFRSVRPDRARSAC
jgi:hypothetical protein